MGIENIEKIKDDVVGKVEKIVHEGTVSKENRIIGALCYIILILVPLFVIISEKKKNKFLAFHAYQSLVLIVGLIVYSILLNILGFVLHFMGIIGDIILFFLSLLPLVVILLLAWETYKGKMFELPIMGEMALKLSR